jgi:lipid II:glycine glycyltransferase (peptidoglycan interpeptide bridge formation enzyme)
MYQILSKDDTALVAAMSHFIYNHENGHFLQSPQWATVKRGWRWRGVLAYDPTGTLVGALSVLIRPLPLGLSLLYAPRGPVCDRSNAAVVTELLAGVQDIAKSCHGILFLLDPDVPDEDTQFRTLMENAGFTEQVSAALDNIQAQYVMRVNTAGRTEEEVFASFCSKTRYNIRVALRHGVEIRSYAGDAPIPAQALDAFSKLMKTTGERDHFVTRSADYFRTVLTGLGNSATLFLAYLNNKPIAGTIGVFQGQKAWYLYGASSNEHREVMPNYLLQWEMIRHAIHLGCTFYDLRGVPGNPSPDDPLYGLYRFKKGFSGQYTKFTGLFLYPYHKILGTACWSLFKSYRSLLRRRAEKPTPPTSQPQPPEPVLAKGRT